MPSEVEGDGLELCAVTFGAIDFKTMSMWSWINTRLALVPPFSNGLQLLPHVNAGFRRFQHRDHARRCPSARFSRAMRAGLDCHECGVSGHTRDHPLGGIEQTAKTAAFLTRGRKG